jgi:hypothetical protein
MINLSILCVCEYNRQKGDQGGERTSPKHVFANPYEPFLCPILSMPFPFGYRFPKVEVGAMFSFFTKGDQARHIRPFMHRSFCPRFLIRADQQYYSKAYIIFKDIVCLALNKTEYDESCINGANHLTAEASLNQVFTKGFDALVKLINDHVEVPLHRPHTMSYMTMYDHYTNAIRK